MTDPVTAPEQEQSGTEAPSRSLSLLASQTFGDDFRGTVEEPKPEESVQPEAPEAEAEQPEPEEQEAAEAEGEEQPEPEASEDGTEAEDDKQVVSSFSELVESQEWDWDWFKNLSTPVKVDGESVDVSFSDLVKSYRTEQEASKRITEAKTQAEAATQEIQQRQQALDGQFKVAAALIENAEQLIDQDASQVDWADLRQSDPAEYAARKDEIRERRAEIDRMKREAVDSYQTLTAEQQKEAEKEQQEYLVKQQTALLEKLPEWKDEKVATAERSEIVDYLRKEGFEDQDIFNATDHRLVIMARKAMQFEKGGEAKASAAKKKVAKVPVTVKPSAPKSQDQINQEQVAKQQARLKKSGNIDDALSVLRARRSN